MKITVSSLADIPGLGPARRTALEKAGIADLEGLLAMKVAELAAVQGIGMWQARKIREYLRQAGLLLEGESGDGQPIAVLRAPETPAEAEVIIETVEILEAQVAVQSQLETEIEALSEAVAEAQEEAAEQVESVEEPPTQTSDSDKSPDGDAVSEATSEPDSAGWRDQIRAQREQLPESALSLMEAIRQAAVSQQLTRQITRLLIIAGEFLDDGREFPAEARERVQSTLARAERMMHEAIEGRAFSPTDQKDLARRLRRRRKELEALLGGDHVDDDDS